MSIKPYVSCICPTYNRRKYLHILIYLFKKQDYPKEYLELIILDDSEVSNIDIINNYKDDYNIKYYYNNKKLNLGEKRNILNSYATGEYIVCIDDDDYFPSNKISYTIEKMKESNSLFSACEEIYIYSTFNKKIYLPTICNYPCNGTFTYHKNFLLNHKYKNIDNSNEEKYFLNNYK